MQGVLLTTQRNLAKLHFTFGMMIIASHLPYGRISGNKRIKHRIAIFTRSKDGILVSVKVLST